MKGHRQCLGFGSSYRLILKDESQTVVKRFGKPSDGSSAEELCGSSSSNVKFPPSTDREKPVFVNNEVSNRSQAIPYPDVNDLFPGNKIRMTPVYEKNQTALFCCRETVTLRHLSWLMSDDKWVDLLPEMMGRSDALTFAIYANAESHIAKMAGATLTPRQALTYHLKALKELQRDLYDPIRQTSDETLFSIILLGVFDV